MQQALDLDGCDSGPLFAPARVTRPLVRPRGKEGVVHRAQTRRATPAWADLKAVKAFYDEAKRLTRETGKLHVVDHIVPKLGRTTVNGRLRVMGLHVPWNLRVISAEENTRKGNWLWPDMWETQVEIDIDNCVN